MFECLKIFLNLYKLVGSKLGNGQRIANSLNSSPVAVYEFIVCKNCMIVHRAPHKVICASAYNGANHSLLIGSGECE